MLIFVVVRDGFADVAESEKAVSKERHNRGHNATVHVVIAMPSLFLSIDVKPS